MLTQCSPAICRLVHGTNSAVRVRPFHWEGWASDAFSASRHSGRPSPVKPQPSSMRKSRARARNATSFLASLLRARGVGVQSHQANCQNKMGLKGCKWSNLNAPGTQIPLCHSVLELDFSLSPLLALWGNKEWPPTIKMKQIENSNNKVGLKGCKWSNLNAPGTQTRSVSSFFGMGLFPFLTISPLG